MVTSSRAHLDRPEFGDVVLEDWRGAGLPLPSVVRAGRLLVLEQRVVLRSLGRLTGADIRSVDQALASVLGLA